MSLLLANGHPDAADYPISRLWDEAALVIERKNSDLVNIAVVIQKATSTTGMTAGRESAKAFSEFVKALNGD